MFGLLPVAGYPRPGDSSAVNTRGDSAAVRDVVEWAVNWQRESDRRLPGNSTSGIRDNHAIPVLEKQQFVDS